ncbi:AraC-like DNA-binding protein [Chitinophaga skermanii]|uniref:AraC-like DNA-binding protein n=1 Tax=Chitinophaga skermanii TaxID=331697 RepID=A0A327QXE7_9BACT|nr:AraC family transcriptional regulator [Chitinophaga skermanii]RAJ08635.1 AraC-like DNA-binding protein [Chitinophaga skermanii]
MQFLPSASLAPYIKSYTFVTIEQDLNNEVFYPSGCVDLVMNVSSGSATTIINGRSKNTPSVELLGHLTLPTRLTVTKGTTVLITRIYPFASTLFVTDALTAFTNYATDLFDVHKQAYAELFSKLMEVHTMQAKVRVLEQYFLQLLQKNEHKLQKVNLVQQLSQCLVTNEDQRLDVRKLAQETGVSERYIQKLYAAHVGINPVALLAVTRFNKSVQMVLETSYSLTAIAYTCGYYDQAHFIREFKKFTGITPSGARRSLVKNGQAFQEAVNIGF